MNFPDRVQRFIESVRQLFNTVRSSQLATLIALKKRPIVLTIIVAVLIFLAYYIVTHPSVIDSISHTNPLILGLLLVLYLGIVATQVGIMYATVRLCHKELLAREGLFLTVYSTLANFFGPLQSGPGVRAVYLKKKIGLRIRDYTFAALLYYFIFAFINGSLLFYGSRPILTYIGILTGSIVIILITKKLHLESVLVFILAIFLMTALQILLTAMIYFIELNAVNPAAGYSFVQAILYGASANLSMFVSITPGGIGIREGFIVFARSLHHIPLPTIVSASILDRAFYIAFLVLLFIISSSLHLKDILFRKKAKNSESLQS